MRGEIIAKIDKLIKKAAHECTMSGNVDAKRYLTNLKKWVSKTYQQQKEKQ